MKNKNNDFKTLLQTQIEEESVNDFVSIHSILARIETFFKSDFIYNDHQLSTQDKRSKVFEVISMMISNFLKPIERQFLKITVAGNENDYITDSSALEPTGDWFNIKFQLGSQTRDVIFKIKHVGKPVLDIFEKLQISCKEPFPYWAHGFSRTNNHQDAFLWIKNRINTRFFRNIVTEVTFNDTPTDMLIDNSQLVPTGDWIKVFISAESVRKEIIFKFKNIGKEHLDFLDNLKTIFDSTAFLFKEHHLTTQSKRVDAWNFFKQIVKKINEIEYEKITFYPLSGAENFVTNNSPQVPTGDWFDIRIKLNDDERTIRLKVINVGAPQLDIFKIFEEKFSNILGLKKHSLSVFQKYSEVHELIKTIADKSFDQEELDLIDISLVDNYNTWLRDDNPLVLYKNGDLIKFRVVYKLIYSREFVCKIADVKNLTDLIVVYFFKEITYQIHKLWSCDSEIKMVKKFKELIKKLLGPLLYQSLNITNTYNGNKLIGLNMNNNQKVYNFQIVWGHKHFDVNFKIINIRNTLEKISKRFEHVFDFFEHHLDKGMPRILAFNKATDIIKDLIGVSCFSNLQIVFRTVDGRIIDNSAEIPTGDWFEFCISLANQEKTVRFKIKNVGFQNILWLQAIKRMFEKPLAYSEHQMSINSRVRDVQTMLLQKIKNNFHNFINVNDINVTIMDRDLDSLINYFSTLVPDGDFFSVKLTKNDYQVNFILKLANVGGEF